jgi:hypothetical protein
MWLGSRFMLTGVSATGLSATGVSATGFSAEGVKQMMGIKGMMRMIVFVVAV